jgi:integrative and conjugative element protein (TIGR02256 family)
MKEIILNSKSIHISDSVLDIFEKYKQNSKWSNESGGILLGQVTKEGVYILKASTPNKFDKGSRYSFECNKDGAQIIMDYEFINSNKKTIYIGEWHTHPEPIPTPSGTDINMIQTQYKKNKINEPFLLLIIQGTKELYVGLFDGKAIHNK